MATNQVIARFGVTSIVMWILPLLVLFVFNKNLVPGVENLSPEGHTLVSGFLAVISVNAVIGFYIYLAMKDPPTGSAPQPDPAFEARARASLGETPRSTAIPTQEAEKDKKSD